MEQVRIEIMRLRRGRRSAPPLPAYMTPGAAGMDLCADLDSDLDLGPLQRTLVPTGIAIALPVGFEGQIRPRSGLALRHGLTLLNSPGTIDSDYRGEIRLIAINLGAAPINIQPGQRIAQLVVQRIVRVEWQEVTALTSTVREQGGFGHTDKKD